MTGDDFAERAGPSAEDGSVAAALRAAVAELAASSDTPRLDAEWMMAHALGVTRSELLLRHMRGAAPAAFAALVERRRRHEPIAYILGHQAFYGLEFRVGPDVLIPRSDSEVLVDAALRRGSPARTVLDCGTGSGALLLAVLAHLPEARGVGIDRSAGALAIARANTDRLGLADRVRMVEVDWTRAGWADGLGAPFDLILANPPYVEDEAELAPSVRAHEPPGALFAGPEGLDAYRVLLPQMPALLAPGGAALVEIGASQARAVASLARTAGLRARLHRDLGQRPRVMELTHSR